MKTFKVCLLGHSYIRDLKSLDIHEIVIDSSYRIQFNYIFKPGANIPYFLKNENLESLYSCAPDVLFLFLGGNDIRLDYDIHETISQYKLLVQTIACNLPKTDIICSYIEPRFAAANRRFKTPDPGDYRKLAKKFNNWLQRWDLPQRKFLTWGSNRFENIELFKSDLVHLNAEGIRLLWDLFEDLLLKVVSSHLDGSS